MPKIVELPGGTPVNVEHAVTAFCSAVRLHLVRYYLAHPSRQIHAALALGVPRKLVSAITRELVSAGVLSEQASEDNPSTIYRVDVERVEQLLEAARAFTLGADQDR